MSGILVSKVLDSALVAWLRPVAVAAASFADDDGHNIFPKVARIATMTGRSERQVHRALKELRRLGVLRSVGRAHQRAPVKYHFHAAQLPQLGDASQLEFFPQPARAAKRAKRRGLRL